MCVRACSCVGPMRVVRECVWVCMRVGVCVHVCVCFYYHACVFACNRAGAVTNPIIACLFRSKSDAIKLRSGLIVQV